MLIAARPAELLKRPDLKELLIAALPGGTRVGWPKMPP
jgi:hypothetical protein